MKDPPNYIDSLSLFGMSELRLQLMENSLITLFRIVKGTIEIPTWIPTKIHRHPSCLQIKHICPTLMRRSFFHRIVTLWNKIMRNREINTLHAFKSKCTDASLSKLL